MSHLYEILAWTGWIWFAIVGAVFAAKAWRDRRAHRGGAGSVDGGADSFAGTTAAHLPSPSSPASPRDPA
ncbi:MAG TPA: hypothetical protein VER17_04015 [Tepidisphaeraceae bacterium]|nr:hypothetical protein [Tepidisphaeraceae bacterium]